MQFKQVTVLLATGLLLTTAAPVFAKKITNYTDMVATLREGKTVHAVIDVDKCHYANGGKNDWNEKTLGFKFDDIYERVATDMTSGKKMRLVAASTHDYVGNKSDGMFISRSLMRVFENGNVEVWGQAFSLAGVFLEEGKLLCQLSANGGVTLISK